MALPASGQISLGTNVNTELSLTSTAQISLGATGVRNLYGVPAGAIRLAADGYGKSSVWTGTISAPQSNLNLYTWATTVASPAYPGSGAVQVTVAPGVYVWADGASGATTYGMNIPASFPSTVTLVNNGYIMGQGGYTACAAIANTTGPQPAIPSGAGQPAINIAKPVTITNNSYIAGGGGGGGGRGGGGAGGGASANRIPTGIGTLVPGGAIGSPGTAASSTISVTGGVTPSRTVVGAGASGGRVLPGTGGAGGTSAGGAACAAGKAGGAGGGGGGSLSSRPCSCSRSTGGVGGGSGSAGSVGTGTPAAVAAPGGGGGWGAAGAPNSLNTLFGQPGGQAITLNANSVTWGATGTIYGSVA
jgi:hypothetical protein